MNIAKKQSFRLDIDGNKMIWLFGIIDVPCIKQFGIIFQMKEKFGSFVVYLEPANGEGVINVPESIRNAVNDIANEGIKLCRVCGERKIQTVVESRLQWRCLDHWDQNTQWKVR